MGIYDLLVGRLTRLAQIDAYIQDQTSDPIILRFNKITNSTTLAADIALFDRSIEVVSTTGIVAPTASAPGSYLILYSASAGKVMPCSVKAINGNIIDIDRPADFAFLTGTIVDVTTVSMNIDSSANEEIFGLRGPEDPSAVGASLDINELRLLCITDTVPTLEEFADLGANLENAITIRSRNGGYKNIAAFKSNAEILGAFGNWIPYIGTNPGIGVNGFVATLTFNGQDKHGVTKRLDPGDDLEIVLKSSLQSILLFEAVAIGHVVVDRNTPPVPVL